MHAPNVNMNWRRVIFELALVALMLSACRDSPAPTSPDDAPSTPMLSAVDVAYCNGLAPIWLAFQDGDGVWTRAQPQVADRYTTFHQDFAANRGAIATAANFASGLTAVSIMYGAPSELAVVGDTISRQCGAAPRTLLGSVAGLDSDEVAIVSAGYPFRGEIVAAAEGRTFQLGELSAGPQEILATRGAFGRGGFALASIILRRLPALPDSATIPVLDFGSPEVFQPAVRSLTLLDIRAEGAAASTRLRTAHGEHSVGLFPNAVTAATRPYFAIPAERLEPGDLQILTASTVPSANVSRSATVYFRTPTDQMLAFGPSPSVPVLSVASSAPTLRFRARLAPQAEYDRFTSINYQQGQNTVVALGMTAAYARLIGGEYDLVVPDLSSVQGFDPRWAMHTGAQVLWRTGRIGGTLGLGPSAVPVEGTTRLTASDAGFLNP
ncbi:MAG TPA: hypothetical protein VKA54_17170 [Gemmatimonadaceae bacterium]|nr:hypothetical protein [Gemmatimonadaceae bacterium]